MRRLSIPFVIAAMILSIIGAAGEADAQRRNERQIRDQLRMLNAQIDEFQYGLDNHLRSSSAPQQQLDEMHDSVRGLQTQVDDFEENLNNRRDNRDDIRAIVMSAIGVDSFLMANPQNRKIDTSWQDVRMTIENLAANYGLTPDWKTSASNGATRMQSAPSNAPRIQAAPSNRRAPTNSGAAQSSVRIPGLNGTYALDAGRSDVPDEIIAETNVGDSQRADLQSKLAPPEQFSLSIRGNTVTLTSTNGSATKFIADGRDKVQNVNGKSVRVRATIRGEELTIATLSGETDYTVIYTPIDGGRALKVTRRVTTEYLPETVFAESIYNKTDFAGNVSGGDNPSTADTSSDNQPPADTTDSVDSSSDSNNTQDAPGTYSSSDPNDRGATNTPNPSVSQPRSGNFIVPNGMVVTGMLESAIDTKVTQNNDRFKMLVQSPNEFRGAMIEGYVTGVKRSGQVSGRSNVTLNFETITLRNGMRYDFAGFLQAIRDSKGNTVKVDSEGTIKGGSQEKEMLKRGGIGAGIGAVIGAIAGGGGGAAIGAAIGGGAGAGSKVIQGRDDLRLLKGSMITVQASSTIRENKTVSKK